MRITDESNEMSPKKGTLTSLRKKRIKNQQNYAKRKRLKSTYDDLVTNNHRPESESEKESYKAELLNGDSPLFSEGKSF